MYFCSSCGQPIEKTDRFCFSCGEPLEQPVKKGRWWPPVLALVLIFALGLGVFLLFRPQPVITTDATMPWFTVQDGALYFDEDLYTGSSTLRIPTSIGGQSITTIGSSCFAFSTKLVSVELPEGITHIGDSAFFGCENLRGIQLPETVSSLGNSVFGECHSLEAICLPAALTWFGQNMFTNCHNLRYIFYSGTLTQWKALDIREFASGTILSCSDGLYQLN